MRRTSSQDALGSRQATGGAALRGWPRASGPKQASWGENRAVGNAKMKELQKLLDRGGLGRDTVATSSPPARRKVPRRGYFPPALTATSSALTESIYSAFARHLKDEQDIATAW